MYAYEHGYCRIKRSVVSNPSWYILDEGTKDGHPVPSTACCGGCDQGARELLVLRWRRLP
jgi:hypothetical protein